MKYINGQQTASLSEKPLLIVDHGDRAARAKGADDFSRFYLTEFYQEALSVFVSRRQRYYGAISGIVALFMIFSFAPVLLNSKSVFVPVLLNLKSVFAYILLFMGLVLLGALIYCLRKTRSARSYCEKNIATLFGSQLAISQTKERAVVESRFYEDRLEQLIGTADTKQTRKEKKYEGILHVFETDSLFFFQGVGWVPKDQLGTKDCELLGTIINANFSSERFTRV